MDIKEDDEKGNLNWKTKYDDLNVQFDEYQKRSNDLEIELESILKQSDDKIRDLEVANNLLKSDNDKLKAKYNEISTLSIKQISDLQIELTASNNERQIMQKKIVELELKNERLEQNYRIIEFSFNDLETQNNQLAEDHVILELTSSALQTNMNQLVEDMQRLRDESRDLKQELLVREKKDFSLTSSTTIPDPITNEKQMSIIVAASVAEACSGSMSDVSGFNEPEKQSKPTSALNYVGDVFKKITSKESKLIESHNLMKYPIKDRRSVTISSNYENSSSSCKIFKRETRTPP